MNFAGLVIGLALTALCVAAQTPPSPQPSVTPIPPRVIDDPTVPSGWRRYQIGDAPGFSLILPTQPEVSAERSPATPSTVVHLYIAPNDNAIYAARTDA